MKHFVLVSIIGCFSITLTAQTAGKADSVKVLQEVIVRAFEQNRQLREVSAAINYIDQQQLSRYNNTSLLPALNATPGVHMEERSPGSYRLNVRGSTLRSPFGVRNVKVYWNGIPFTDPGGNTYLNQLSFFNVNSMEVIKGPASSLYGAGTGGALLINSQPETWKAGTDLSVLGGSYNLMNLNVQVRLGSDDRRNTFGYSRTSSDGYRNHTNMRRDVASWETQIKVSDKQQLQAVVLYGDLYYQTPGGLTKTEYLANHRAARPAAGQFPSAQTAQAAIYQQTFLAGFTHQYQFTERLQNTTSVYGAFSQIKNPTFRNYEKRMEPHFGGRTVFSWQQPLGASSLKVLFGGEGQRGFFSTKTYKNKLGKPDTLQTDDDINNWLYSVFAQADVQLPHDWTVSAGVSVNHSAIRITRLSSPSSETRKRSYDGEWAPRIAISKKIIPNLLAYASVSKGFSPPTAQEVLPSTMVINTSLEAEQGVNYEVGVKSNWFGNRLYVEVNAFWFQLENTIVQRRDAGNADYFENAGSTRQKGIESQAHYQLLGRQTGFISQARIWASHTYNHFRYQHFKQLTNDFSGKQLPSVAPHTIAAGIDLSTKPGIYTNITWYYSDPIALNDANTDMAAAWQLTGARLGWRTNLCKKLAADLFAGVDNLFDTQYSLGNDINAAGGRYFNAAQGVNYFGGITLKYAWHP